MSDRSTTADGEPSDKIAAWLAGVLPTARPPFTFTRVAGGRSNLTFVAADASGARWILRRPPSGNHPAGAHNVLREAQLLRGLHGQVPVPAVIAECSDPAITDAPLIVMEFLDGLILRSPADVTQHTTPAERAAIGPALIDTLVALHRADPGPLGLGGLVERRDFATRQLRRWHENWLSGRTRELRDLGEAHRILAEAIPAQRHSAIVHGDFRLDNCLLGDDMAVTGVLDWELTTVGDPLADLGQFLVYWAEPGDADSALNNPPTAVAGFSTRAELAERYCTATGSDPAALAFFVAFNWWKVACIVEDVYSRSARGQMSFSDRSPESFARQAERLAAAALDHAAALT